MAYSAIWDETLPTGAEAANTIDDIIRALKRDVDERLIDIFGMPSFATDPLRPYLLKFSSVPAQNDFIGGSTGGFRFRDSTNGFNNLLISDAGAITTRAGINGTTIAGTALIVDTGTASAGVVTIGGISNPAISALIQLRTGNTQTAWAIAADFNFSQTLEFTPSTAVGGVTFSTPVMKLTASAVTIAQPLTVSISLSLTNVATLGFASDAVSPRLQSFSSKTLFINELGNPVNINGAVTIASGGLIISASGLTVSSGTTSTQALTSTTGNFSGLLTGSAGLTISSGTSAIQALTATTGTFSGIIRNEAVGGGFAIGSAAGVQRIQYTGAVYNFLDASNASAPINISTLAATSGTFSNGLTLNLGASASILMLGSSVASANSESAISFFTGTGQFAWQIGAQINVGNTFEIIPSTIIGGAVFAGTAVFKVSQAGLATISNGLIVTAGTTALQAVTSGTINGQTISAAANLTGSLVIANGLTVSAGTSALQALTATTGNFSSLLTAAVGLTITAGATQTSSGSTSIPLGAATTIFTVVLGTDATYLVTSGTNGSTSAAIGVIFVINGVASAINISSIGTIAGSLSVSGANIQLSYGGGTTQTINWSYLRLR